MADRFFDTSAAVKHYHSETGTAKVDALLAEAGSRHFLSDLAVVEFHSVMARLVRTGTITVGTFHLARGRFLADIASGLWQVLPVPAAQFHDAQHLLLKHGLTRRLRTLDAIQLAAALALHASMPLDAFVSADINLGSIATAEGLTVVNPEVP
jgi:predicted nucleic acid-binding protein